MMNSRKTNFNAEESDFVQLLQKLLANEASSDALFEHPVFKSRLRLVTMANAQTTADAEDLATEVSLKVWKKLSQFEPNYSEPYGNFFAWLRTLTRNAYIDSLRRKELEFDERRPEDLDITDTQSDIEASVLYKEVMAEFEMSINALPERERLAMALYLQGFSFREISEKMTQAGYSSSRVKVRKWIKDSLMAFWSGRENVGSKNIRVTRVRATRAKREFHSILEQAINSGTLAVRPEDTYPYGLAHGGRRRASKPTQQSSRRGWESANELLARMQHPESKHGIQAAFDASPEELGRAAVEHAKESRKVPVSSLTTFLMATSTVNVVERVMNLTKDVA
jgi:RNA polymerase sigma factor (sigma-70 family)